MEEVKAVEGIIGIKQVEFSLPCPEKYRCCICSAVSGHLWQSACKHVFCSTCTTFDDGSLRCPFDQSVCTKSELKECNWEDQILSLEAFCTNKVRGCIRKQTLAELKDHLHRCGFSSVCCPHDCSANILRKDLTIHLEKQCQRRLISCEHCEEYMPADEFMVHESYCRRKPMSCRFCQDVAFPREEIELHEAQCPMKPRGCKLLSLGCDHKATSPNLLQHETSWAEHSDLVIQHLVDFSSSLKALKAQQESTQAEVDKFVKSRDLSEEHLANSEGRLTEGWSGNKKACIGIQELTNLLKEVLSGNEVVCTKIQDLINLHQETEQKHGQLKTSMDELRAAEDEKQSNFDNMIGLFKNASDEREQFRKQLTDLRNRNQNTESKLATLQMKSEAAENTLVTLQKALMDLQSVITSDEQKKAEEEAAKTLAAEQIDLLIQMRRKNQTLESKQAEVSRVIKAMQEEMKSLTAEYQALKAEKLKAAATEEFEDELKSVATQCRMFMWTIHPYSTLRAKAQECRIYSAAIYNNECHSFLQMAFSVSRTKPTKITFEVWVEKEAASEVVKCQANQLQAQMSVLDQSGGQLHILWSVLMDLGEKTPISNPIWTKSILAQKLETEGSRYLRNNAMIIKVQLFPVMTIFS